MNIPIIVLQFLAEIVGTFLFVILILLITSKWTGSNKVALPIGLALALCIFLFGDLTGGHFNPAVSFGFFVKDPKLFTGVMLIIYTIGQVIGGIIAVEFHGHILEKLL